MELSAGDQVGLYLFERDAFFMLPRPGNQLVLDILPQCPVFLEVDYGRRLAAFRISDELNSGHGPSLLGWCGTCPHSSCDATPCQPISATHAAISQLWPSPLLRGRGGDFHSRFLQPFPNSAQHGELRAIVVPQRDSVHAALNGDLDARADQFRRRLGPDRDRRKQADVLAGFGVNDQYAAISVAVGDIEPVCLGIDRHVCRLIEQRRAIDAAVRVVAVWSPGRPADPHLEVAVHVELQNEAVAAPLVGRPGRCGAAAARAASSAGRRISRNPDIILVVDVNSVLAVGPDAASFRLAFATDEAGIGGTAPGPQQAAAGIELQNGGSGFAAIRYGAIGTHLAQRVDRLTVLILCTGQWTFQPGFLVRPAARPVIDPDVVVLVQK